MAAKRCSRTTVGFISNLPTQLLLRSAATLEEVLEADVILHVRDISHEDADAQQRDVDTVLCQLGIDPDAGSAILEIWNKNRSFRSGECAKTCKISPRAPAGASVLPGPRPKPVRASTALLAAIEDRLAATPDDAGPFNRRSDGAGISCAHRNSEVLNKELSRWPVRHDRARR